MGSIGRGNEAIRFFKVVSSPEVLQAKKAGHARGGRGFSKIFFGDTYSVMNNWGANNCVMSYGHIGADLISLASVLRIPVYMHNVDRAQVFRPSAWAAFGTDDLMGADFRACTNFGPLY